MSVRLFIYGTLMRGQSAHGLLEGASFIGEAQTAAIYSLRNLGDYPGLVLGGDQAVHGEIYEIDDSALPHLDRYEGHPELYLRMTIELSSGERVTSYVLTGANDRPMDAADCSHPQMDSGKWRDL